MQSFTDLEAWKAGMDLVEEIYRLTANFPRLEQYGLIAQLRRASTGIVAILQKGLGGSAMRRKHRGMSLLGGSVRKLRHFYL